MAGLGALNQDVEINNGTGGSFTLLADDDYELEVIESDVKANSKGTGQNLDWKIQVASGPHKGVTFFSGITSFQHESAQAQAIGQGQLKAACAAMGVDFATLADSEQLHFKPFWGRVNSETYTAKSGKYAGQERTVNRIAKFLWDGMPEEEAPTPAAPPASKPAASAPPAANPAPASAKPKRPWEK